MVLLSLMVLHKPEGQTMETALSEVATRAAAEEELSAQVCHELRHRFGGRSVKSVVGL